MRQTAARPLVRLSAGFIAFVVAALLFAGFLPRTSPPAAVAADVNFTVTGTVQGVAYDQNVIEVAAQGGKQSIHVTPTTSIAKHGEVGSISDLRPGVHVVVSGVVTNGQRVAVSIEIK
ncbi:MAG: hypothetical protein JO219_12720 [Candidatus Eremiobacteraeota bacterium]|nr:hypothetical protein [Candidatus Eremiobacteraeota bacterium]